MKNRIMIVDDDKRYLELLEFLLISEGYDAIPVQNSREVLAKAEATAPHAIILDIAMPELDGVAVGMSLKSNPRTASIPLIYVTALSGSSELREGMSLGAVCFLTKPFTPTELTGTIRRVLGQALTERAEK